MSVRSPSAGLPTEVETLLEMYRRMYTIRQFEGQSAKLYRGGEIPGFVHLAIGQEASAVGACFHLTDRDVITSTHRGHGHALAKGLELEEMFAELMGRETGVCHGRGGSMHISDPSRGIFGANGIVGAGIPIAHGAAFASSYRQSSAIALAFLGDGAVATGAFHEAANLASLWKSPLILFCENNGFSEFSHFDQQHPVPLEQRALAYGLHYRRVDGNDVAAVSELMNSVVSAVRDNSGPYFIEALTHRVSGHYEGDPQLYRDTSKEEARDPLEVTRLQLIAANVTESQITSLQETVDAQITSSIVGARAAPFPDARELDRGLYAPRPLAPPPSVSVPESPDSPQWKMFQAIAAAITKEMEDDENVFVAGIDVGDGGNVFGITRGMKERWPRRMIDTPISESAIVGLAIGAAMAGLRPIIEVMYFDFIGVCMDQIMNQAAKLRYMTGGRAATGLTLRTQFGAGRSSAAQHSQSLEAMIAHIPGLTVVMPSNPSDAYGLLRASIQDSNPVLFVENRLQYGMKALRCADDHFVPIGEAAIRTVGTDVTIVSYSRMVETCIVAAENLAKEGISCEVIDLRTIVPMDFSTVLTSVKKTNKVVIVHEATRDFGVGAEISARLADEGIWYLDGPVVRVAAKATPAPYSQTLEVEWLPNEQEIVSAVQSLVRDAS